jgi:AAA15 family ATPase/GTPase
MILSFTVKNFLSIRDEQTLSFEATADATLEDVYVVKKDKTRILKLGMIFGPNAAGKTNILLALDFLRKFALTHRQTKDLSTEHVPFMLDATSKNGHGYFELSFYIRDILHIYSLKINHAFVNSEKLVYYPGIRPAIIFNRQQDTQKDIAKIEFGSTVKLKASDKALIEGNTLRNMSVIAAFSKLNLDFPELKAVYQFFDEKMFPLIKPKTNLHDWTTKRIEKSDQIKKFVVDLLNNADFNIADIKIETILPEDIPDLDQVMSTFPLPEEAKQQLIASKSLVFKQLLLMHKTGADQSFGLTLDVESAGTNRLFELGGALNEALRVDGLLNIDEIESSMHPDLVIHFINTFLANSKEAQLVCTTHEINILSEQDNLRKDIIWFTQKSPEGATELYSLADFNIRRELSFINAYKAGKFGAKPNLGTIYLEK